MRVPVRSITLPLAALLLVSCKPPEESRIKAIIGAVLIDGSGAPPISRSVLLIAGSRVRAVGEQASTPIPAGSDKVNGAGLFLVPAPVAIPEDLPRVRTLAEARSQIDGGAVALAGMVLDTEKFDGSLLNKWRDLQVVFVPGLHRMNGQDQARALRNCRTLASRGVLIAAGAGPKADTDRRLLAGAGFSPAEVLAAATRNAARAASQSAELGSLAQGMRADLWLLAENPLENPAHLAESKAERIMSGGEWIR